MAELAVDVARFAERADPGATAGTVKIYTKDVAGVTHTFGQASDGTVYQMTPTGVVADNSVPYSGLTARKLVANGTTVCATNVAVGPYELFPAAADTFTLVAAKKYKMRCLYAFEKAAPGSGATLSVRFGGTATYTRFEYRPVSFFVSANTLGGGSTPQHGWVSVATTIGLGSTGALKHIFIDGLIQVNAGGTFIPQFSTSVLTDLPVTVLAHSFCELIELGASTFTSQGGWA